MADPAKYIHDSFELALEAAIAQASYAIRDAAALHLLRAYARQLDANPQHVLRDGPKYMSMLATMNLVPIREVRRPDAPATPAAPEEKKDEQPQSGPGAALLALRSAHGPHTRTGTIAA